MENSINTKITLKQTYFFQILVGRNFLGSLSDRRLELQTSLEESSGNCQMTRIMQNLFHGMWIIFYFSIKGDGWVGSVP